MWADIILPADAEHNADNVTVVFRRVDDSFYLVVISQMLEIKYKLYITPAHSSNSKILPIIWSDFSMICVNGVDIEHASHDLAIMGILRLYARMGGDVRENDIIDIVNNGHSITINDIDVIFYNYIERSLEDFCRHGKPGDQIDLLHGMCKFTLLGEDVFFDNKVVMFQAHYINGSQQNNIRLVNEYCFMTCHDEKYKMLHIYDILSYCAMKRFENSMASFITDNARLHPDIINRLPIDFMLSIMRVLVANDDITITNASASKDDKYSLELSIKEISPYQLLCQNSQATSGCSTLEYLYVCVYKSTGYGPIIVDHIHITPNEMYEGKSDKLILMINKYKNSNG